MKHIERLMIRARRTAQECTERLTAAFIFRDGARGVYVADGRLWDGTPGTARSITCECATEQAAFEAIDQMADQYPPEQNVVIFYGDYDMGG